MNAAKAIDLICQLDGVRIVPDPTARKPTFLFNNDESLAVQDVTQQNAKLTFALLVPTVIHDCHDYIWMSERDSGTTNKVVLVQSGTPIEGAKVTDILREGQGYAHDIPAPERYRFTFEIPLAAITNDPLQVHFLWSGHVFAVAG